MKLSLSKKMILLVLIIILPMNGLALIQSAGSVRMLEKQLCSTEEGLLEVHLENLTSQMKITSALLYYFGRQNVHALQMEKAQEKDTEYLIARMKFFAEMSRLAEMTDGADGYFFYFPGADETLYQSSGSIPVDIRSRIQEKIAGTTHHMGWEICETQSGECLFFLLHLNKMMGGAWISLEGIRSEIQNNITFESVEVQFSQGPMEAVPKEKLAAEISKSNLYIRISQDKKEVLGSASFGLKLLIILTILFILAIPMLLFFQKKYFVKPLNSIRKAHRKIQAGEFDYRIREPGNSPEYDEVYQSFNQMAEDLKTYRIDAYEKEIERQRIELRNLQLQIRPHFLLNTFNLVYTLIQQKNYSEIEEIILYLSAYFRYMSRTEGETVPFSEELSLIRGYVKTAAIRYSGRIEAVFDVDSETEKVQVPPLLLHNFVENTVKHGIRPGEILHICFRSRRETTQAVFEISDDGNGMDAKTLLHNRQVLSGELSLENENAHIGLYNSYKRLKHLYGETACIEVDSKSGEGTHFVIRIPAGRKENA